MPQRAVGTAGCRPTFRLIGEDEVGDLGAPGIDDGDQVFWVSRRADEPGWGGDVRHRERTRWISQNIGAGHEAEE